MPAKAMPVTKTLTKGGVSVVGVTLPHDPLDRIFIHLRTFNEASEMSINPEKTAQDNRPAMPQISCHIL